MGCSCSPYPCIDISSIFKINNTNSKNNNSNNKEIISKENEHEIHLLQHTLKEACSKYGCFHIRIDTSVLSKNNNDKKQHDILSPLIQNQSIIKNEIETLLFDQEFIQSILVDNENCDTTMSTVQFQSKDKDSMILNATYRGRSAESGSKKSTLRQGEPKQSWEFFRCPSSSIIKNGFKLQNQQDISRIQVLQSFVRALHEVVVVVCSDILNLPKNKFICEDEIEDGSKDLLRAFRYDALTSTEEQESNLGSSSHTDWGCMTAVWQDSKGGLQIYCHEHECWNDVEVDNIDSCDDSIVRLFFHVGDYLSLAMNSTLDENNNVHPRNEGNTKWSSPTHRVLCPLRVCGDNSLTDSCRCSLVYFAYPPNGISIFDAISSLQATDLSSQSDNNVSDKCGLINEFPYHRFMVLNNQSTTASPANDEIDHKQLAKDMFQSVLHQNFDKVIEAKWKQVQR